MPGGTELGAPVDAVNRRYGTSYGTDFFDLQAFGRDSADFAGSPTRSSFSLS